MKKKLLILAAVLCLCAGAGAAYFRPADPAAVSGLLSQRLELMGLSPGPLERQGSAALKGARYVLPFTGGELELYAYRNQDSAARELLQIDESGCWVGEVYAGWTACPHFFLRDNVIVLYQGEDPGILDMLERLCGAQIRGGPLSL